MVLGCYYLIAPLRQRHEIGAGGQIRGAIEVAGRDEGIDELAAAMALSFADGLLAMLSQIASTALLTAYLLVGFAVLHVITLPSGGRVWWLSAAYLSVAFLGWPALLIVMLGLIDGTVGLRRRFSGRTGPPTLTT